MVRLRQTAGDVQLIDARSDPESVARLCALGIDINEGFVVEVDGRLFHGEDAIHSLALLTTPVNAFNRLNRSIFSDSLRAAKIYPWLVRGRAMLLRILGRKKIDLMCNQRILRP
jgi:uncharacterized membrane protein